MTKSSQKLEKEIIRLRRELGENRQVDLLEKVLELDQGVTDIEVED